jgi:hypothetical protein
MGYGKPMLAGNDNNGQWPECQCKLQYSFRTAKYKAQCSIVYVAIYIYGASGK